MTPDSLYQLLPAIYRIRDIERGKPLEALMKVVGEQAAYLHQDIDELYDNWFIETCADWAVPYLGELVGFRRSSPMGEPGDAASTRSANLLRILYPRREVSRLVDARRRKGTLKVFEDLARFVAGWRAHVIESRADQAVAVIVGRTAERDRIVSAKIGVLSGKSIMGSAPLFRRSLKVNPNLTDVQSAGASTSQITLLVWRRSMRSLTRTEPAPIFDPAKGWQADGAIWQLHTFSPFGFDTPLVVNVEPVTARLGSASIDPCPPASHCSDCDPTPSNAPTSPLVADPLERTRFLSRDVLRDDLSRTSATVNSKHYGDIGKSLAVANLAAAKVAVADLTSLTSFIPDAMSRQAEVYIDPKLGRLAFRRGTQQPVSYHFATSATMGGGEYSRTTARHSQYPVHRFAPENTALTRASQLDAFFASNVEVTGSKAIISKSVGFEFTGSTVYRFRTSVIRIRKDQILELRASNKSFPILRFVDQHDKLRPITIEMEVGSQLAVDGMAIWSKAIKFKYVHPELEDSGRVAIHVNDALCDCEGDTAHAPANTPPQVNIRHTTIVPRSRRFGDPHRNGKLELCMPGGKFIARDSIIAEIQVSPGCDTYTCPQSPVEIQLQDSIVERSIGGIYKHAFAALKCARSTIFGTTRVHRIESADDMIFGSDVSVERQQIGSMRFSYARTTAKLPRRYKCIPDSNQSVEPTFVGKTFGQYGFAQLDINCHDLIRRGAESGSEMGAFHNLFESQRRDRLYSQVNDFTPVNMTNAIVFADETPP